MSVESFLGADWNTPGNNVDLEKQEQSKTLLVDTARAREDCSVWTATMNLQARNYWESTFSAASLQGFALIAFEGHEIPPLKGDLIEWLIKSEAAFTTFSDYLKLAAEFVVRLALSLGVVLFLCQSCCAFFDYFLFNPMCILLEFRAFAPATSNFSVPFILLVVVICGCVIYSRSFAFSFPIF
jgi:hypothetical protein